MIHRETLKPWILDFGIAKDLDPLIRGPDTLFEDNGFRPDDGAGILGDIYALGGTILALTHLLQGADQSWAPVVLRCPFSNDMKDIISKMVEKNPTKRFQSCEDILFVLCGRTKEYSFLTSRGDLGAFSEETIDQTASGMFTMQNSKSTWF